jgi:hypothetical protein
MIFSVVLNSRCCSGLFPAGIQLKRSQAVMQFLPDAEGIKVYHGTMLNHEINGDSYWLYDSL